MGLSVWCGLMSGGKKMLPLSYLSSPAALEERQLLSVYPFIGQNRRDCSSGTYGSAELLALTFTMA